MPGSVPSARAPNSSRGGLESSALKESPGGRCGNKQTVTIQRPEGSRGNEHRLFGKPTGDPDPGDASRAPLAPVPDGGGAGRGRRSYRQSCLPAARPVHSESGSPPPRLHRRRITAAQLTAAPLTAFPPTPARIPPPARLLPASAEPSPFACRELAPRPSARSTERGHWSGTEGVRCPPCCREASPDAALSALGTPLGESGEANGET